MSLTLALLCTLMSAQSDAEVSLPPPSAATVQEESTAPLDAVPAVPEGDVSPGNAQEPIAKEEADDAAGLPQDTDAESEDVFVLAGGAQPEPINIWHLEAGLQAALQPATDGSNFFVYRPTLRVGKSFGGEGWLSFIDTSLALRFNGAGTDRVAVRDLVGSVAARYGYGPYLGGSFLRVHPYAFAGAHLGGGVSTRRVDDKNARRPILEGGLLGGVGVTATLFFWTLRIDCSVGNRNLNGDARAAMSTGVVF